MDDTRGSKWRALLAALIIGILTGILIIKSQTPAMFLSWFFSLVEAFFLFLLAMVVLTLVIIAIGTVIRHFIRGRFSGSEQKRAARKNQVTASFEHRNGRYTPRSPIIKSRPPNDFTENGC